MAPHRGELLARDPLRPRRQLIDLERSEEFPAAAAADRLLAWTAPARAELGIEPAIAAENGAQRQRRALAAGQGIEDVFAAEVARTQRTYAAERGDDVSSEPGRSEGAQQPSEEELRAALEEQMKRIKVDDVLLQTVVTLVNLAGRRLGLAAQPGEDASERDLGQARQAIDGVRALLPLCPEDQTQPIKEALSQLQMAYARESGGEAPASAAPPMPRRGRARPGSRRRRAAAPAARPPDEAERAKARSKLWTPPGS